MPGPNRRKFLWMAFGAGGAALGLAQLLRSDAEALPSRRKAAQAGLTAAKRTGFALGTQVSMLALHEHASRAREALDAAFAELETVEEEMSIYRPQSQLARLNRDGDLRDPHPYLYEVLAAAQELAARSDGAFDVTVQPLWSVHAQAAQRGALPGQAEIDAARAKVGWRKLSVERDRIRFAERGMAVTLNGIAQGFAADRALAALRAHGVRHALVNTGEVGALGRKENGAPWKVGIQDPRQADAFAALANLEGRCLSTSGDYATAFSPDRARNHLFDPATGCSPEHFSSVTVVAPSGMHADALSTAVFVAGVERGMALVGETPQVDAFVVRKDGRTFSTAGFPAVG